MTRVHLLCGLPGAGKTTHARRLAAALPAVRFVPVETAVSQVARRAAHEVAYSHVLDEAGVRHLQSIFEEPDPPKAWR